MNEYQSDLKQSIRHPLLDHPVVKMRMKDSIFGREREIVCEVPSFFKVPPCRVLCTLLIKHGQRMENQVVAFPPLLQKLRTGVFRR